MKKTLLLPALATALLSQATLEAHSQKSSINHFFKELDMLRPFFEEEKDFFRNWFSHHPWEAASHRFSTDIFEENDTIVVEMLIPGMKREDIEVEVTADNHLRVSGSRKSTEEKKEAHFYKKEISYGSFEEIITLPADVKHEGAQAEVKDGILRVVLPKKNSSSETKKISVQ